MENKTIEQIYAEKWQLSSKFFDDAGYYQWMASKVKPYDEILELGCGVGYSTQTLLKDGHKVVAVEKNQDCVLKAQDLLSDHAKVSFIHGDIVEDEFRNQIIQNQHVDAVICWNPGTQMDAKSLQYYVPFMIDYGLTPDHTLVPDTVKKCYVYYKFIAKENGLALNRQDANVDIKIKKKRICNGIFPFATTEPVTRG